MLTTVASSMAMPEPRTVAATTQRPRPLERARGDRAWRLSVSCHRPGRRRLERSSDAVHWGQRCMVSVTVAPGWSTELAAGLCVNTVCTTVTVVVVSGSQCGATVDVACLGAWVVVVVAVGPTEKQAQVSPTARMAWPRRGERQPDDGGDLGGVAEATQTS